MLSIRRRGIIQETFVFEPYLLEYCEAVIKYYCRTIKY